MYLAICLFTYLFISAHLDDVGMGQLVQHACLLHQFGCTLSVTRTHLCCLTLGHVMARGVDSLHCHPAVAVPPPAAQVITYVYGLSTHLPACPLYACVHWLILQANNTATALQIYVSMLREENLVNFQ